MNVVTRTNCVLDLVAALLLKGFALIPERCQLVVEHGQRRGDGHVHVEVLVRAQAAAEEDVIVLGLGRRALAVGLEHGAVLRGVDRVIRLVAGLGEAGVLLHDDRLIGWVLIRALRVEVTELVDAGVIHVRIVVVHDRGALEVAGRQNLEVKIERAPTELALGVVEVAVKGAGVDDGCVRIGGTDVVANFEPVSIEADLDVLVVGHRVQPRGKAIDGQTLVGVIEVTVVEGVAHGQARDIAGRQLLRIGLPLLRGVVTDEGLVERTADERDSLLFEVVGFLRGELAGLLGDERAGLVWGVVAAEELVDKAQAHGELVGRAVVHGEDAMLVVRERRELIDVVPHALIRSVEEVGAVLVDLNAGLGFGLGVGVAA